MLVLKLCEQFCPEKIPFKISSKLGDGADGEVFDIEGEPDKAIKFGVLYQRDALSIDRKYKAISTVLDELIQSPADTFAKVYCQDFMGTFTRKVMCNDAWKQQPYILYHYVMEKLYPLSDDETKVLWTVVSHNDFGIEKNYKVSKMNKMILERSKVLDFDAEKLMFFCENYRSSRVKHLDVHVRNIMKDKRGNFKLIDFDRSEME